MGILSIGTMFMMMSYLSNVGATDFNIVKYGAKPNTDITKATASAFADACASPNPSKVVVPQGTYKLAPIKFSGPCKAPILEFHVQGTLIAITEGTKEPSWVSFSNLENLVVFGNGVFDGQGPKAWGRCPPGTYCKQLPLNLAFNSIKNGTVRDITCKDSKQFQVNVVGANGFIFHHVKVIAPKNSPNTDGIHIGRSTGVRVLESTIQTGDDCVSVGDGTKDLLVEKTTCGPGHGFSVGSLGKYENEGPVDGIVIRNCTLTNTQNGVRIKTWPDSKPGEASNMHFEDLIMNNVEKPIIVDQVYCPWNQCNAKVPSRVKITGVFFKKIRGTSSTPIAMKIGCSAQHPCRGVEISDIDLEYRGPPGSKAHSECANVIPKTSGKINPPPCTHPISSLN